MDKFTIVAKISFMAFAAMLFSLDAAAQAGAQPWRGDENICAILAQDKSWPADTLRASRRWQVQPWLPLAVIYHESRFEAQARPPMKHINGIWQRPSSAYGFAQAIDSTWNEYNAKVSSKVILMRDEYQDAVDFASYYLRHIMDSLDVSPTRVDLLYLAYHEGISGYTNKSYSSKKWLIKTSGRVAATAALFHRQWLSCYGAPIIQQKEYARSNF